MEAQTLLAAARVEGGDPPGRREGITSWTCHQRGHRPGSGLSRGGGCSPGCFVAPTSRVALQLSMTCQVWSFIWHHCRPGLRRAGRPGTGQHCPERLVLYPHEVLVLREKGEGTRGWGAAHQ